MMKLSRRLGTAFLMLAASSLAGCSQGSDTHGGVDSTEKVGNLALPLTTQGASGVTYRLRDATFLINGFNTGWGGMGSGGGSSTSVVVSSETDPNAATISVPLEEGQYYVELQPGWHFEKVTSTGTEDVEATLLYGSTQWVYVSRHSTSFAEFQFGLGGRELWLNGELNVGVVLYEDPSEIYGGWGGSSGSAGTGMGGFSGGAAGAGGIAGSGGTAGASP